MHVSASEHSSESALITTFYGKRDRLGPLHDHLFKAVGVPTESATPSDWQDPTGKALLRCFDPPAAHDTTVIQLALNAPGTISTAWSLLREQLAAILDYGLMEAVWGYSLLYQASTHDDADLDATLCTYLSAAKAIDSSQSLEPLADAETDDGRLWLLRVPLDGDGLAAASVYVALGPNDQEERFLARSLYGPNAALIMPDLIAHKGYHQIRQYRLGSLDLAYAQRIRNVHESATRLLADMESETLDTDELTRLAREYNTLTQVVPMLSSLRISLQQQTHNYSRWSDAVGFGSVFSFHRDHLDTAVAEVNLLVSEGRDALDFARTVVEIAQVRLDRAQERRHARLGTLLTIAAVALTVPAVIDPPVASELLRLCGAKPPADGFNALLLLGVRTAITLVLVALALVALRVVDARKGLQAPKSPG